FAPDALGDVAVDRKELIACVALPVPGPPRGPSCVTELRTSSGAAAREGLLRAFRREERQDRTNGWHRRRARAGGARHRVGDLLRFGQQRQRFAHRQIAQMCNASRICLMFEALPSACDLHIALSGAYGNGTKRCQPWQELTM